MNQSDAETGEGFDFPDSHVARTCCLSSHILAHALCGCYLQRQPRPPSRASCFSCGLGHYLPRAGSAFGQLTKFKELFGNVASIQEPNSFSLCKYSHVRQCRIPPKRADIPQQQNRALHRREVPSTIMHIPNNNVSSAPCPVERLALAFSLGIGSCCEGGC